MDVSLEIRHLQDSSPTVHLKRTLLIIVCIQFGLQCMIAVTEKRIDHSPIMGEEELMFVMNGISLKRFEIGRGGMDIMRAYLLTGLTMIRGIRLETVVGQRRWNKLIIAV